MQTWGINPNQLSFNTIMDAYAREGNVNNVVKIYNYMQVRAHSTATAHEPSDFCCCCLFLLAVSLSCWIASFSMPYVRGCCSS